MSAAPLPPEMITKFVHSIASGQLSDVETALNQYPQLATLTLDEDNAKKLESQIFKPKAGISLGDMALGLSVSGLGNHYHYHRIFELMATKKAPLDDKSLFIIHTGATSKPWAYPHENPQLMSALLNRGLNLRITNEFGHTPFQTLIFLLCNDKKLSADTRRNIVNSASEYLTRFPIDTLSNDTCPTVALLSQLLLQMGRGDTTYEGSDGRRYTSYDPFKDLFERMVHAGANIETPHGHYGETLLQTFVKPDMRKDYRTAVHALLVEGADQSVSMPGHAAFSVKDYIVSGKSETLTALYSHAKQDLEYGLSRQAGSMRNYLIHGSDGDKRASPYAIALAEFGLLARCFSHRRTQDARVKTLLPEAVELRTLLPERHRDFMDFARHNRIETLDRPQDSATVSYVRGATPQIKDR